MAGHCGNKWRTEYWSVSMWNRNENNQHQYVLLLKIDTYYGAVINPKLW